MNQKSVDAVKASWGRLLRQWESIDEDEPHCWRKECGMFIFYITESSNGTLEFSANAGDDTLITDITLQAPDIITAMKESDSLISEIIEMGVSVLKTDEIRIRQAFAFPEPRSPNDVTTIYHSIIGVGVDGRLYYFNGQKWEPKSMQLET